MYTYIYRDVYIEGERDVYIYIERDVYIYIERDVYIKRHLSKQCEGTLAARQLVLGLF
jgi:hypothetical protein